MPAKPLEQPTTRAERFGRFLDRLIFAVSPERGARRMTLRRLWATAEEKRARMATRHEGAQTDRLRGGRWLGSKLSPDSVLEEDLETLRDRSRELADNDALGGSIDTLVDHVIGSGLRPQAQVKAFEGVITKEQAEKINRQLEGVYDRWQARSGRDGRSSFGQQQRLMERNRANDGEGLLVMSDVGDAEKPIPLALEVIDVDRLETPPEHADNPRVRLGVERDAQGKIVAYWILTTHPDDTKDVDFKYDRVPAERVCHYHESLAAGASRGKPLYHRVTNRAKDAKDFDEATVIAAQVEACFGAFVTAPEGAQRAAIAAATETTSTGDRIQDLEPAMVRYLEPGQEVTFATPQRPGQMFAPYMEWNYRRIAAGANLPYELVVKNWSGLSFAGGRLALTDGRVAFGCRRTLFKEQVLQPVWNRLVDEAVILGEVDIDPVLYRQYPWLFRAHGWIAPAWPYAVSPGEEIKADAEAVEQCQKTLADVAAQNGYDLEELLDQREREEKMLADRNLQRAPLAGRAAPADNGGSPKRPPEPGSPEQQMQEASA